MVDIRPGGPVVGECAGAIIAYICCYRVEVAASKRIRTAVGASVANDKLAGAPPIQHRHVTSSNYAALLHYRAMRANQHTKSIGTCRGAYADNICFNRSPGGRDIKRYIRVTAISKSTDMQRQKADIGVAIECDGRGAVGSAHGNILTVCRNITK